jgi:uncharacterized protein with ParB-like and HNH nuclease domain
MTNPTEYNITTLFTENEYVIPIYQRNYAWGESQVNQLIQDIWDSKKNSSDYYLGTLIIFSNRPDNKFETIDGQQRLTTLSILLSVLKNEHLYNIDDIRNVNLNFDSRKKSTDTLKVLFENKDRNRKGLNSNILIAYDNINKKIKELIDESNKSEFNEFCTFLFKKVKILQVAVPNDTDLNHYFEIMNNRGEQLEKHEILKAYCLEKLENEKLRNVFAKVWDACSQMDKYVQYGFEINTRHNLFGKGNWNQLPTDFDDVVLKINSEVIDKSNDDLITLSSLLENPNEYLNDDSTNPKDDEKPERFNTIINFSNFLLQVVRVSKKQDVKLDDKELIETFKSYIITNADVKQFGYDLLKSKFLYDKYIIKRELYKDEWTLKQLKCYDGNKGNYVNSFENENERVLMLLSMFHVSFPTLIYKHWFTAVLKYLFENENFNNNEYIEYLETTSDKFFYGRSNNKPEKDDYFDIIFEEYSVNNLVIDHKNSLHNGTDVKNFIFNRLDYLIWRDLDISIKKDFKFSFRSSVEHYFPQHPKNNEKFESDINRFGNLCLISRSKNSELSNYSPLAKKEHYSKSTIVESLKQQLMMKYEKWDKLAFEEHEKEMIGLLLKKTIKSQR